MSEPTKEQLDELHAINEVAHADTCTDYDALDEAILALIVERDDARAEAAMANAAEDGAMQSANELLERLNDAIAEHERLRGLLRLEHDGDCAGHQDCDVCAALEPKGDET